MHNSILFVKIWSISLQFLSEKPGSPARDPFHTQPVMPGRRVHRIPGTAKLPGDLSSTPALENCLLQILSGQKLRVVIPVFHQGLPPSSTLVKLRPVLPARSYQCFIGSPLPPDRKSSVVRLVFPPRKHTVPALRAGAISAYLLS